MASRACALPRDASASIRRMSLPMPDSAFMPQSA
jgi:hypothetical protein